MSAILKGIISVGLKFILIIIKIPIDLGASQRFMIHLDKFENSINKRRILS